MTYTPRDSRFNDQRSVTFNGQRSVTETILEAISQSGLRPTFSEPAAGRRNRFGKIAAGLAVLAVVAAVGFALLRPASEVLPFSDSPVAVLETVRGSVTMLGADARPESSRLLTLAAGEPIHAGAVIETRGTPGKTNGVALASTALGRAAKSDRHVPGRAAFRLAGGPSVRLDAGSRVRVASPSALVLERGAVYVDSAAGSGVEVRTTLGVVRDVGTQFEVRLLAEGAGDEALRVRVREGRVLLRRDGESHEAGAGAELSMRGDGTLTRAASPIHGAHWDWVLEAAPVPEIEGRPLRAFLDWLAREGGWTLAFAEEGTAELASTIILHGDTRDLTPREATSMVFKGSGLDYRLEGGTFFVEPRPSLAR